MTGTGIQFNRDGLTASHMNLHRSLADVWGIEPEPAPVAPPAPPPKAMKVPPQPRVKNVPRVRFAGFVHGEGWL